MPFVVGLDLGKDNDPSALAVVSANEGKLGLVHLERMPLHTPYTAVAKRVASLVRNPRLFHPELVIDKGGVGGAVADILTAEGIGFLPVTLTSGKIVRFHNGSARVPKTLLMATLESALRTERLKVARGLKLWPALREELQSFERKIDKKTANLTFEHRTKDGHGDLVIATALAVWKAEHALKPRGFAKGA